jgi:pantoate--beta-alanine ligase
MDIIRTVDAMQAHADARRCEGHTQALVPTMGALHDGHFALVRTALDRAEHVVVSIFVNPTQFGPDEDYGRYPRDLEADRDALAEMGVDAIFAPPVDEMYPHADRAAGDIGQRLWVEPTQLDEHLCGRYRPGHFRGVTTVVTKLFNVCKPDVVVFGRKDAQQLVILQRMVDDLGFDIDVVGVPTVREEDGLACSSRNQYLSDSERAQAVVLSEAVQTARERIQEGEQAGNAVVRAMRKTLGQAPDAEIQYAQVVDAHTLQPVDRIAPGQEVLAAVAVYFGDTRLIDNAFVTAPNP